MRWTHAADRTRPLFGYAMILGGFGAPLFLFLAGLAVVLSAESKLRKTGDFAASWWAAQKRGWQVFGLAFLFRLQSYILSGGYSAAQLAEGRHSQRDGAGNRDDGAHGTNGPQEGRARRAVCGGCRRHHLAHADRPRDAAARVAARPNRVVFPANAWPHQLHPLSMGRVSCSRVPPSGSSSTASGPPETRQAPPGDARHRGRPARVAGPRSVVPAAVYTRTRTTGRPLPSFFFLRVGLLTLLLPLGYALGSRAASA